MNNNDVRHCSKQTYVITNDLGERIEGLRMLGLRTPSADDQFFLTFHEDLRHHISAVLPDLEVVTYDMKKLVEEIWTEAFHVQRHLRDALVVSSCAEIASIRRGRTIEVNRVFDENGEIIGLGPRPGNPPLEDQISSIAAIANGNPIVLVEDGIFTGTTLEYLISKLQQRHVKVSAVVAGLSFPGAVDRLKKLFSGEIIIMREVGIPFEWMPDHDFVPFTPNCGRVFGGQFGGNTLPYYTHDGYSYSIPYILPFGDPVHWASIPKEHALDFSMFCMEATLKLFCKLDEMNQRQITMHDLIGSTPRVCVPMSKGNRQLPTSDKPISDFLSEVCHELV